MGYRKDKRRLAALRLATQVAQQKLALEDAKAGIERAKTNGEKAKVERATLWPTAILHLFLISAAPGLTLNNGAKIGRWLTNLF